MAKGNARKAGSKRPAKAAGKAVKAARPVKRAEPSKPVVLNEGPLLKTPSPSEAEALARSAVERRSRRNGNGQA